MTVVNVDPMKLRIAVLTALLGICAGLILSMLSGCARFNTVQYDKRYNESGGMATEISTKATATAILSSKQLANWKASQTEKSQGATVGVEQQGATNAIAALNAIAEIVKAAGGLVKP